MSLIQNIYCLPFATHYLIGDPQVELIDMSILIKLCGHDKSSNVQNVSLFFKNALCYKYSTERFTKEKYNAYDKVVEIVDSDWLQELRNINPRDLAFWNPHHYAVYIENDGLYQIIASGFRAELG